MTLVAIVFGVIGLILAGGWVSDIFSQLGEALIHSQSGHAQVYKTGFFGGGSRSPEKYLLADADALKERVSRSPGIDDVMARLNFSGLLSNGRSDLPIIGEGVEANRESKLGTHLSIVAGRRMTDSDTHGILVGAGLAHALKLRPGDDVTLLANTLDGALNTLDLQVVGVFQSFSNDYDARAIKILLPAAQDLLSTASANALVISLKNTSDTEKVVSFLRNELGPHGLEAKTWVELNDFYEKTVELYRRQFGVLQLIVLVMVILGVANSVNMSVFERLGEFGTMRSLGNRSGQVFRLVLSEAVLLGLLGSGVGVILGVLLALSISAVGIPMPPPPNANLGYTARIQITPYTLFISFAIGFAATVLAALLPARRVSRVPVVEALRANV
jgi:putative ABC transport system permease protein